MLSTENFLAVGTIETVLFFHEDLAQSFVLVTRRGVLSPMLEVTISVDSLAVEKLTMPQIYKCVVHACKKSFVNQECISQVTVHEFFYL